ncbi:hypothetical protein D1B33_03385 [Lysinibacillus yapensis]|uniref:Putative Flp pilus-assembly TadG-like N-terminal domain-containing protein n=1 Tax=Ureibacillus yapensis TaxID=2304605 RepID=A0A396SDW5_9BACL|nr:flp pilus-assembly TadE/G-like family protein [Lysinibacillus yapensis]RHW39903.1 hypothetical protein D1B33_03385 [Lysinibacillus yapensis]
MKVVKNEKGSAAIYLLWLTTVMIVLTVIIVNIARVYAVKQQSSTAAQLGAFAATSEILFVTEEVIKEFDDVMAETHGAGYEPLWNIIEKHQENLMANDYSEQEAYIKALNEILPVSFSDPVLKDLFDLRFQNNPMISTSIYDTVRQVIRENGGNDEHLEIFISPERYRVEVKTDATFDSIADGEMMKKFSKDIPQKGYGPELSYLKYILN